MDLRVAIIGCGHMGQAYAKAFLQFQLVRPDRLLLVEKSPERRQSLEGMGLGTLTGTLSEEVVAGVGECHIVLLAVKPQDYDAVAPALRPHLRPEQLVLSIMAGVPTSRLCQTLNHQAVVRAMPNTPALVGQGMTGLCAAPGTPDALIRLAENLINATGRSQFFEDESFLDAVTALSGSGPAYFYYVVRALVEAGRQMGLDEPLARLLVRQTMLGAYHLIQRSDASLDDLIKAVASKGGTTEAALSEFARGNVHESLVAGVLAAENRSKELSGQKRKD